MGTPTRPRSTSAGCAPLATGTTSSTRASPRSASAWSAATTDGCGRRRSSASRETATRTRPHRRPRNRSPARTAVRPACSWDGGASPRRDPVPLPGASTPTASLGSRCPRRGWRRWRVRRRSDVELAAGALPVVEIRIASGRSHSPVRARRARREPDAVAARLVRGGPAALLTGDPRVVAALRDRVRKDVHRLVDLRGAASDLDEFLR